MNLVVGWGPHPWEVVATPCLIWWGCCQRLGERWAYRRGYFLWEDGPTEGEVVPS